MPGLGKPTVGSQYSTNGMIVSTNGPMIDADISGFSWGVNINGATAPATIDGSTTGQQLGNVLFVLDAAEMVAGEVLPFAITGDPSIEVLFRAINPLPASIVVDDYASGKSPSEQVLATPSNKLATDGSGRIAIQSGTGAGQLGLSGGQVTVGTNADKTGYSLTSAYDPAKTAAQAGDAMTLTSAYDPAKTAAQAGDPMALTSGERTTLAAVIWAVATSTLTAAGSIGKLLADNINATVSGVAAAVWGYTTRLLTGGTNIVLAKGDGLTGLNDLDAAGIRSAVGLDAANADAQLAAIASAASSSSSSAAAGAASAASVDAKLTNSRAGYLDNLNVGGPVSSQADINAINQSASRRVTLATVPQFERPESGSASYMIEMRTYDGDGMPTNADATPTITPIGITSGSLADYLGSITSPTTGVYRATYSVATGATAEQIRFDAAALVAGTYFPQAVFAQVVDQVSANFNTTDRSNLTAIANKLPSKSYLTGTANSTGDVEASAMTGNFPGSVASVVSAVTAGTVSDKTGYALTSAYDPAKTAAQAGDAMTLTGAYDPAKTAAQAGDAMSLTSGERSTLAGVIWAVATSSLTTAGSIGKLLVDNVNATVSGVAAAVWAYGARVLTAGTNIVLAKGTGVTGLNDLDAADMRAALGLAAADVDAQLAGIKSQTDKVGTNSGDSGNTQTMQGRVTAAVATAAQVAALTAPDNAGIASTLTAAQSALTQATQANTSAAAAMSASQNAQSAATGAQSAANTAAQQASNAAMIASTRAVTIASDGLRLLPYEAPTSAPTNLHEALALLAFSATCKMGGPSSGPGTITLFDADGNAYATRLVQFANGGQTITALVLS